MKNLLFLLAVVATISLASCKKGNSIVDVATDNGQFTVLIAALERAGLTATLDGDGDFTVFAPTDAAFNAFLSANGFASVNDVPVATLQQVLLNHVVAGHLHAADITTGYINTEATYNGEASKKLSMYVAVSGGTVTLNGGAMVTTADVEADNGVIHIVDEVIGLPTIVTHAVANPSFSTLVGAVSRNDFPSGTNYVTTLSGAGPFTVFAPNNAAFDALELALGVPDISLVPSSAVEPILTYHVVSGNVRSGDLSNGQVVNTLNGGSFSVVIASGSVSLDTNGNAGNVPVIATDVQCANGVIHVVEAVLMP